MVGPTNGNKALFSISQVNALTGVPRSTIRFWEKRFTEFLDPTRTAGNQRRYDENAVELIQRINHLVKEQGYTLEGVRKHLQQREEQEQEQEEKSEAQLTDLAETMSDFLLKRLFDRVQVEMKDF